MSELGIGSTVYVKHGAHFTEYKISGERPRLWEVARQWGDTATFPKKPDSDGVRWGRGFSRSKVRVFLSHEDIATFDQREQEHRARWKWIGDNRYAIGSAVYHCDDMAILRQVAALVGYQETPK